MKNLKSVYLISFYLTVEVVLNMENVEHDSKLATIMIIA